MITQIRREKFINKIRYKLNNAYRRQFANDILKQVFEAFDDSVIGEIDYIQSPDLYVKECLKNLKLKRTDVFAKRREQEIVFVRFCLIYILYTTHKLTQREVADLLSLSREVIPNALKKARQLIETKNNKFMSIYEVCYGSLYQN